MAVAYSAEVEHLLAKATVNVEEMATLMGVGIRQAYDAVNRGDIPSIRLGKRILISTRVLQGILDAGSIPAEAA